MIFKGVSSSFTVALTITSVVGVNSSDSTDGIFSFFKQGNKLNNTFSPKWLFPDTLLRTSNHKTHVAHARDDFFSKDILGAHTGTSATSQVNGKVEREERSRRPSDAVMDTRDLLLSLPCDRLCLFFCTCDGYFCDWSNVFNFAAFELPTCKRNQVNVSECYTFYEQENNGNIPPSCEEFRMRLSALGDGSLARDDFGDFFSDVLEQGVERFITDGVPDSFDASSIDLNNAKARLEQYIFDNSPLKESDFDALLALFPESRKRRLHQGDDHGLVLAENSWPNAMSDPRLDRQLQSDDDLSPECIDVIIRIVVEVIGLVLSAFGIRARVLQPFTRYFVMIKGGRLNGLVLEGYRRSRGEFDVSFFVGLVVSFLSILTWEDIKNSLATLGEDDWISLAIGLSLAIAGTLATGGAALFLLVTGALLQGASLAQDVAELGECFALCSDGFTQSGGQQTTTYPVALDRSQGTLTLTYNMFTVPDRLDLVYEGATIFSTGGLVSGSQTVERTIDGEEKAVYVTISAPNSGTLWEFSITCPVPDLLL